MELKKEKYINVMWKKDFWARKVSMKAYIAISKIFLKHCDEIKSQIEKHIS
jgi:hypothetical protein